MFSPASERKTSPEIAHEANSYTQKATPRSRQLTRLLAGIALALVLGLLSLPVAKPAQAQSAPTFVFTGGGWGHGVGMSQNGARNMADNGIDHVGILAFYYPNTYINKAATTIETIRVHIGDATDIGLASHGVITFEQNGQILNAQSGSVDVKAVAGGLRIGNVEAAVTKDNPVIVSFANPIKVENNGHSYLWGKFQLTNHNGKVRLVEVLPFEKYVAGIAEMPASWHIEALMSQAITARTYAHQVTQTRRASQTWNAEYDISATTVDQNYIGWDAQDGALDGRWTAAVKATAGVELYGSQGPIRAYYSASNGGYTETSQYVFGFDSDYTAAKVDPYDTGRHQWSNWTRSYTQTQMTRWLNRHPDTSVGTLTRINVLGGTGPSARLDSAAVELVGSNGTKRVSGKRLMRVINAGVFGEGGGLSTHLPSTFATIGHGASAGMPNPSGQLAKGPSIAAATQTSSEDQNSADSTGDSWKPAPGAVGIAPTTASNSGVQVFKPAPGAVGVAPGTKVAATSDGWRPAPGAVGVAPIGPTPVPAAPVPAAQPNPAAAAASDGWRPAPGAVGVAPIGPTPAPAAPANPAPATPAAATTSGGWQPAPGAIGVPPVKANTDAQRSATGPNGIPPLKVLVRHGG